MSVKELPKPGMETAVALVGTAFSAMLLVLTAMNAGPLWRDETNTLNVAQMPSLQDLWDNLSFESLPKIREVFPKARAHSGSESAPVDQCNKPNEIVHLGGLRFRHRETPGHAEDGVTYLVGNRQEDVPHVAIVGDTTFADSMRDGNGAWDLAGRKVSEEILSLPPGTLICPGHGPLTMVAGEQEHNPFF